MGNKDETNYSRWGEFTSCPNFLNRYFNKIKKGFIKDKKGNDISIPVSSSISDVFGYIDGFSKGEKYGYCYNGSEKIAWDLGINYTTVRTCLQILEKIGLIVRVDKYTRERKNDPGLKSETVAYVSNLLKVDELYEKEKNITFNNDDDRSKRSTFKDFVQRKKIWAKEKQEEKQAEIDMLKAKLHELESKENGDVQDFTAPLTQDFNALLCTDFNESDAVKSDVNKKLVGKVEETTKNSWATAPSPETSYNPEGIKSLEILEKMRKEREYGWTDTHI